MSKSRIIIVRGAGDIASGIIWTLAYAKHKVICLDINEPSCIRREVSFSEAIYDKEKIIEGIKCVKCENTEEAIGVVENGNVALLVDKEAKVIEKIEVDVVVDAILAKKNIGTRINMAPLVIAVGPGFTAGIDCHYAIETCRGHKLGYIYEKGSPIENTGIPGIIGGVGKARVMYAQAEGYFQGKHKISDIVKKGDVLAEIKEYINGKYTGKIVPLCATIDGVLRGILRDGFYVKKNMKCADIDPRLEEKSNCYFISDKARCIGGSVLTLISRYYQMSLVNYT